MVVAPCNIVFRGIWKAVSTFVDPVTRDKIVFLPDAARMPEFADRANLLTTYGGLNRYAPLGIHIEDTEQGRQAVTSAVDAARAELDAENVAKAAVALEKARLAETEAAAAAAAAAAAVAAEAPEAEAAPASES